MCQIRVEVDVGAGVIESLFRDLKFLWHEPCDIDLTIVFNCLASLYPCLFRRRVLRSHFWEAVHHFAKRIACLVCMIQYYRDVVDTFDCLPLLENLFYFALNWNFRDPGFCLCDIWLQNVRIVWELKSPCNSLNCGKACAVLVSLGNNKRLDLMDSF